MSAANSAWDRRTRVGLCAVVALAALLRFALLDGQSLSADEVSEVRIARLPAAEVVRAPDGFPPLFHLVLKPLQPAVGEQRASRLLAATLGTLTLLPLMAVARRAGGPRFAVLAGLLLAVSPFHVQLSRDGRAYPLYVLCAALALLAFADALATNRRRAWLGFAAAAAAGLGCHYYFGVLLALLAGFAARSRAVRDRPLRPALAFGALAIYGLALAATCLPGDLGHQTGYDGGPVSHRRPVDALAIGYAGYELLFGVGLGPSKSELHELRSGDALLRFAPWLLAALVPLLPILRALLTRRSPPPEHPPFTVGQLTALVVAPPLAIAAASAALGVHFKSTYVAWAVLPLVLLLARGVTLLAQAPRPTTASLAPLVAVSLVVLQLLAIGRAEWLPQYRREDLRGAARALEHLGARAAVTSASYLSQPLEFYWPDRTVHPLPDVSCRGDNLRRALSRVEAQRATAPDDRAYLVSSRLFHGDPCRRLRRAIAERYDAQRVFAGDLVEILAIESRSD